MDIQKIKHLIPPYHFSNLEEAIADFQINTPLRLSHFLANCDWESGGFKVMEENLNYTSAERIVAIFRRDFDTDKDKVIEPHEIEFAKGFIRNPVKLANYAYANQNGNGNEASGDGYKYRGRGIIQLTGRSNYASFDAFVKDADIVANPDLVSKQYAMLSAGWFWDMRKINALADKNDLVGIRKKINGGTHGLENVKLLFNKYYILLK
jgi:putative chitinase